MLSRIILLLLMTTAFALADSPLPSDSIYHLDVSLTDQTGDEIAIDVHRDKPVLITMFYATCPKVCPLLIETTRGIERALTPDERASVRVLMITLDPKRDTPTALAKLAKERQLDTSRWTLATGSEDDVRKIAAVLSTQYRRLPDGEYNHASVITLLNVDGSIEYQTSRLGTPDPQMIAAVRQAIAKKRP